MFKTNCQKNIQTPKIAPLTSSASSVLGFGITSENRSLMDLREVAELIIHPNIIETPGVADIHLFGGEVRNRQIKISPELLHNSGISVSEVIKAVEKKLFNQCHRFHRKTTTNELKLLFLLKINPS